jgi:cation diffusion facilitator CzcD-associated flavoprotein CzcO
MATGCLSSPNIPDIEGLDGFDGQVLHTARWPHEPVSFSGRRVGVVGTGSLSIQAIPVFAEAAEHLYVFQRTAGYSLPSANGPLHPDEEAEIKANYWAFRTANRAMPAGFGSRDPVRVDSAVEVDDDERHRVFERAWQRGGFAFLRSFRDLTLDPVANRMAAEFVRDKIRSIVEDPATAELLCPKIVIGCKRHCSDSGCYEKFNRPNVTLVEVSTEPIAEITAAGPRAGDRVYEVDDLVFATGFDAMTGAILAVDITGRDGRSLRDAWAAGPHTYLGLGVAGFPNLFLITGPGSPSVLTNMVVSIEHHVEWIIECVDHLDRYGYATIDATLEAQDRWVAHVNEVAEGTVYNDASCNSWYLGANIAAAVRHIGWCARVSGAWTASTRW